MNRFIAVSSAVFAIIIAAVMVTGDVRTAEYKGTTTCKMCHKVMHQKLVESYEKVAHPMAMQKADAPGAIVGDFASNPIFTQDKVAYALGRGRNEQAYLDANYQVLPAVWDVKGKKWKPTAAADGTTQCIGCHTTNYDPVKKAYTEMGVGCEACHGPGGDHTAGDQNAIVKLKTMDKAKQSMVCGQCHSRGKDPSGKYAHPVAFRPGDDLTQAFVDAKPTAPGRNQQYSEHAMSKHAAAGTMCTDCHDPHNTAGIKAQLRKPENELCLSCHAEKIKDLATHAPTAPEGATCASCHMMYGQHSFAKPGGS